MKYRYTALVAFLPMSLLLMSGSAETAHSVTGMQEDIRYNFEYKCGGERIVISHCRKDSDQPGFAPTQPEADYCQIYYPDRPKRGGFTAMGVELRGDMIKKLQACGALDSPTASSNGDTSNGNTQADDYMTDGSRYFEAKDYPKAIESYKRAADLDPSRWTAFFSLGTVYFEQKEYQLSASAFKQSVTLKPDALGFVLLGIAYRNAGKSAEAVAAFRSAIRLKPETTNLVNAYYGLGATYVDLGRKEDALQAYRMLQTLDQTTAQQLYDVINKMSSTSQPMSATKSSGAQANMNEGGKYFDDKDYTKAIEAYTKAIALHPDAETLANANFMAGRSYEALVQYKQAIPLMREAVRIKPGDADFNNGLGLAYFGALDFPDAVTAYKEAIRLRPDLATAYFGLGLTYVHMGMKTDALQVYKKLLPLDEAQAKDLYNTINKSAASAATNKGSAAERPTSHNIAPQPTQPKNQPGTRAPTNPPRGDARTSSGGAGAGTPEYYLDQGNKFYEAGDFPKAAESFKKALAGFGRSPADKQSQMSAYIGLVSSYFGLNQYALAVTVLKQILIDQPDNVDALTRLGSAYRNLKQYPNALAALNKAISLEPDYALPHYELGELYIYQMQYSKAPAEFQKALSLQPKDPFVLWQIGLGLEVLEHYEEALQAYRSALVLKPTGFLVAALHSSVGETYLSLKQYDKAIASLQEALRLDANQPDAYKDLGVAYSNLKRYPDAVKALQQSVRLKPDNAEAQYELGSAYQELKQYAAAVPPLREALRLKPDDLKTLNELGKAYMFSDQYPQALAAFQQAIRLKPNEPVFHYHLGLTYCFMGKKSEAVQVQRGLQNMDKKLAADLLDTISKME